MIEPETSPIVVATRCRIFMNELLDWTLEATCGGCGSETVASLHMGVSIVCARCGIPIRIDPARTVFHRAGGSGYWTGYGASFDERVPISLPVFPSIPRRPKA